MTAAGERVAAIVLAAGQGTRMRSDRAKVLHALCGRPMLDFVVEAAHTAGVAEMVVVVGHEQAAVRAACATLGARLGVPLRTAAQAAQRGTGDAACVGLEALGPEVATVLILCGDTPLVRAAELERLCAARAAAGARLAMLTCRLAEPAGYGRVVRDAAGRVVAVREHRDCTEAERAIDEVNSGVYAARADWLREALARLAPDNDQGELYLTDAVALAAAGGAVVTVAAEAAALLGVNDRADLARAEAAMHERIADALRREGATIAAGARIDAGVVVERDGIVGHGAVLRGATRICAGARVDVGSVLEDAVVEAGALVKAYSVCTGAHIGPRAQVGPFAHLRPGSVVGEEAHVGNFVETKKTRLERGAKANHLAYLGDGDIGEGANVGAGTIFCNYDGHRKHPTVIGAGAFIGSDSQLVAPVTVGAGAYVATGTTVTRDVPADALAIGRAKQENKLGYAPRLRARLQAGGRAPSGADEKK
jgi:bifunctional UDP-N-acetylglucosamine pyrophosphorylase/glucosamine-1-phosphate N-acetyltransferase